ncbi:hypothetical protein [Pedobacter sp. R20-19]|uniref:hypothetical protein n=1 Tax=Pedobacter sp. R20-19 TaxID=1270196 RepID=UPI0012F827A1|nr:hypothetical protein [Pedobacter sp. R20-19]
MKMRTLSIYLILSSIFLTHLVSAQVTLNCNNQDISKTIFKQDSTQRFNNYFNIEQTDFKGIKESKNQIELRFYTPYALTTKAIDIYILKSNPDSSTITRIRTLVMEGTTKGFKIVRVIKPKENKKKLDLNLLYQEKSVTLKDSFCTIYKFLLDNNIFTLSGNKSIKFITSNEDSMSGIYFEVKLKNKSRNFNYISGGNYIDTVPKRKDNINSIVTYLKDKFN